MPKYYTNFGFDRYLTQEYHCTHAYLGHVSPELISGITKTIQSYLEELKPKKNVWNFDQTAYFGIENNIRVLLLSDYSKTLFYEQLRKDLQIKSEFTNYNPHVTTYDKSFVGIVDRYELVRKIEKNSEVLYSYKFL
jgi:2'-5' RNA ligase